MIEKHNIMYKTEDYVIPIFRQSIGTNFSNFTKEDIDFLETLPFNEKLLISGATGRLLREDGWIEYHYQLVFFLNGLEVNQIEYFESLSDEEKEEWVFNLDEINEDYMWHIVKQTQEDVYKKVKERAEGKGRGFRRVN